MTNEHKCRGVVDKSSRHQDMPAVKQDVSIHTLEM